MYSPFKIKCKDIIKNDISWPGNVKQAYSQLVKPDAVRHRVLPVIA